MNYTGGGGLEIGELGWRFENGSQLLLTNNHSKMGMKFCRAAVFPVIYWDNFGQKKLSVDTTLKNKKIQWNCFILRGICSFLTAKP